MNHKLTVDVLIAGGGPAGTTTARVIAEAGFSVVVVEKANRIGTSPCAGYLHKSINTPSIHPCVVESRIDTLRTHLPDGSHHDLPLQGMVVNRSLFDQALANTAVEAGARILTATPLKGFIWKNKQVTEALCRDHRVKPKIVVGADGVHSTVARLLGLPSQPAILGVQYDLAGITSEEDNRADIFFDASLLPGGYAWKYPTKTGIRAGLGVKGNPTFQHLDRFLHQMGVDIDTVSILARQSGAYPVGGLRKQLVHGNVMLAGDSAGMTDPISGAGLNTALLAGETCGATIIQALEEENQSLAQSLTSYENKCRRLLARSHQRALHKRHQFENLKNNEELQRHLPCLWVGFEKYWKS
jgi:digeranylgeranylglycerophospholipid reductase